jgi:hypothetical protein
MAPPLTRNLGGLVTNEVAKCGSWTIRRAHSAGVDWLCVEGPTVHLGGVVASVAGAAEHLRRIAEELRQHAADCERLAAELGAVEGV